MTCNTSWVIVCGAIGCVVGAVATSATLPPPPAEPQLAQFYSIARDLQRSATGNGYFGPASATVSWPCAVDEALLRSWGGALGSGEMEPRLRRAFKLLNRGQGLGSKDQQVTVRDVKIAPVSARCQEGQLSGVVEYQMEWLLETRDPKMVLTSRMASRVRVTAVGGDLAPHSLLHVTTRTTGQAIQWLDPSTRALMKNTAPDRSVSVSVSVTSTDNQAPSVTLTDTTGSPGANGTFVQLVLPLGEDRVESRQFQDGKLTAVGRLKAGQLHGLFETFEHKVGSIRVPSSTLCYDGGELIKTARCDVD